MKSLTSPWPNLVPNAQIDLFSWFVHFDMSMNLTWKACLSPISKLSQAPLTHKCEELKNTPKVFKSLQIFANLPYNELLGCINSPKRRIMIQSNFLYWKRLILVWQPPLLTTMLISKSNFGGKLKHLQV